MQCAVSPRAHRTHSTVSDAEAVLAEACGVAIRRTVSKRCQLMRKHSSTRRSSRTSRGPPSSANLALGVAGGSEASRRVRPSSSFTRMGSGVLAPQGVGTHSERGLSRQPSRLLRSGTTIDLVHQRCHLRL